MDISCSGVKLLYSENDKFCSAGYPRTVAQAKEFDTNYNVDVVLNLDVPFETITERISVCLHLSARFLNNSLPSYIDHSPPHFANQHYLETLDTPWERADLQPGLQPTSSVW